MQLESLIKHARLLDAHYNRKKIFRKLGPCCLPGFNTNFILLIINEEILSNVNTVLRGQVKSENSSLPLPSASQKRVCLSSLSKSTARLLTA